MRQGRILWFAECQECGYSRSYDQPQFADRSARIHAQVCRGPEDRGVGEMEWAKREREAGYRHRHGGVQPNLDSGW